MTSKYPKDEFDLAGDDMPVGMHRPEPSRWRNVIPFLVILVAVPLLAWSLSQVLTSHTTDAQSGAANTVQSAPAAQPQSVEPETAAPQSEPAVTEQPQSSAPEPEAPQSEPATQAATVNYNVAVSVLNGTGVQGLAGQKVEQLTQAGFRGATAANADGWATDVSVIYYGDPQVEATAREIGRLLDIANVSFQANLESNADLVVVLK